MYSIGNLRIFFVIGAFRGLKDIRTLAGAFLHHKGKDQICVFGHLILGRNAFYMGTIRFTGRINGKLFRMLLADKKAYNKNSGQKKSAQYDKEKLLTPHLLLAETFPAESQSFLPGKAVWLYF